jgi:hypothetical protein
MEGLATGSYEHHRSCSTGDRVVARLDDDRTVSGTVVERDGTTVHVASDDGGIFEIRRVTDSETGERVILLGIDGRTVTDHGFEHSAIPSGTLRTEAVSSHSYDHRVVEFEAEPRALVLGDD